MMCRIDIKSVAGPRQPQTEGLLQRVLRRIRLRRPEFEIAKTAAQTRAERLFEVNYRSTWTR